ncbi:hypothetical protein GCM10023321_84000 [Pseudonocardia eucalypti]|uniref:HTH cro/C1-type domain-containing protein n=1 Tax=Pseudonocardia eucalypti TaxID=648755 RepID=A0ABP9RFU6_9PSEU|nr:hypothetical protein [Pseudonocardia eucalypti]
MTSGIGAEIAARRIARGWSQAQLAAQLAEVSGSPTLTRHDISRWEHGARKPGWWRPYLDQVLGELNGPRAAVEIATHPDEVKRREFLSAAGVVALSPTATDFEPRHVAPELVDYFTTQLAGHYTADMHLGPHLLVPTVTTQYDLLRRLASAAERPLRKELHGVAAAYAAMLGWLHQDAGDLTASDRWRTETLDLAHRTGDAQLIGYALINKAMLATDMRDGATAVDLAEGVLADERALAPKVRILAAVQGAHGYSLLGDYRASMDLLDRAEALSNAVDDAYTWGNAVRRSSNYTTVQRAACLGRLGRNETSLTLWTEALRDSPPTTRRDTGVYTARRATVLAKLSERDEAMTAARDAVACYVDTGSARLRDELSRLAEVGASWSGTRQSGQLREILAPLN